MTVVFCPDCLRLQVLQDPWWVLPAEVLHGLTFAAMWAATTDYAHKISPGTAENFRVSVLLKAISVLRVITRMRGKEDCRSQTNRLHTCNAKVFGNNLQQRKTSDGTSDTENERNRTSRRLRERAPNSRYG